MIDQRLETSRKAASRAREFVGSYQQQPQVFVEIVIEPWWLTRAAYARPMMSSCFGNFSRFNLLNELMMG